jgi:hypothetical protein
LEFDEHGYLLRYQTESYKDFENRRMPDCLRILYFANVLPDNHYTLSEKQIEEKLGIVQSPQATPSTINVAEFWAGTSTQPLTVVILPPGRGPRANSSPYSCCWEDDLLRRLREVIDKDDALVLVDSPNSTPHIKPEVYDNPTKYWFGVAIKKPVTSISSYAAQKSGARIAVLFFWEYRGDTIDVSLYIFDARSRMLHSASGNRQSLEDVELQFRDLLREMHDAPLTALYTLYEQLSVESKSFAEAWRSLCSAANQGNSKAQSEVAYWHLPEVWQYSADRLPWLNDVGVGPDKHIAYMWYTLAGSIGDPIAADRRRFIASMTSADIAKAERMVRDWKPGDCPSAEHRLEVPVDIAQSGSLNTAVTLAAGAGMLAGSKSPSEKEHGTTQPQPAGSLKVGLLPPAFINPTLPSNTDKEMDIYSEIRRYIQSNPSFEVSFDYGVGYGVGSSEIHAVWQGSVVEKVPDKAKMKAIGENLGVDILVLAWITGNRTNVSIDLYVFDVASGKMHQGTANSDQAKQLVESTFAQFGSPR